MSHLTETGGKMSDCMLSFSVCQKNVNSLKNDLLIYLEKSISTIHNTWCQYLPLQKGIKNSVLCILQEQNYFRNWLEYIQRKLGQNDEDGGNYDTSKG